MDGGEQIGRRLSFLDGEGTEEDEARKMGKILLEQSLIYIYPFPPLSPQMHTFVTD
jgi:hypothetical protein